MTLGRILIFNAKRGGEGGKMTLANYAAKSPKEPSSDLNLSEVEQKLFKR